MPQPAAAALHVDGHAGGKRKGKKKEMPPMDDLEQIVKADLDQDEIDKLGAKGRAFKGPGGKYSYPIPDLDHLNRAIKAIGRGGADHDAIRRYVMKVAGAMGQKALIPETWGSDGSLSVTKMEQVVELWKADGPEQIIYGVVLTPGVYDSQGDIIDAGDIRKAAHKWLAEYRKHDIQHAETPASVRVVESFIAPSDMSIAGQQVLKGAWVLAAHVQDPADWQRVEKGELTGWSIGGTGERIEEMK